MKQFNRREALRLSVPLMFGPASLLATAQRAGAASDTEISLKATESKEGWSSGVTTATDDMGKPAVVWTTTADGAVVNLNYNLAARTTMVAHARQLRFRYRFDGPASTTLHFKIVAAPLASGFTAVFRLPYPQPGKWREAVILVQEYDLVWNVNGAPQTQERTQDSSTPGSLQVRIAKPDGTSVALTIGEIWIEPLPKNTPVNISADPNGKGGGRPVAPDAPKLPGLVTAKWKEMLPGLPHPRLLFSAADGDAMRDRAQKTDEGRASLAVLTKQGGELLAHPVQIPERGGQWWLLYVCPKHGRTLHPEGPHRHVCSKDGEVFSGFPYDDVFLTQVHQGYAGEVRSLGVLFQVTGDTRHAVRVREILMGYAKKYRSYPLHDISNKETPVGGRVTAQTVAEAQWLIPMAQGCDLIWETLTPADREALRVGLFYPAATEVIQRHKTGIDSDQCWRNTAIGLTGFLFGDPALIGEALDNAQQGMQAQIARGTTDDGFWYERRWDHHFEVMNALMPLAEAAQNAGIPVYQSTLGERYKRLYLFPLDMAMPNHFLPAFDDNSGDTAYGNPAYQAAYARWGDARLADPLTARFGRDPFSALLPGATLPTSPAARPTSGNFPDAGYAILRAGDATAPAYLAVKYGPAGGSHGHPDKLSFVFWSQKRLLIDDPGPATRGSSMETNWYKTTFAHSTLVVDEENQKPATGKCLDFQTGAQGSAVLAEAGEIYENLRYRRAFFLLNDGTAIVLDLAIASDNRAHTFDFVLHPTGAWTLPLPPTGISGMKKPGYMLLRDVVTGTAPERGSTVFDLKPEARIVVAAPTTSTVRLMRGLGYGRNGNDKEGPPCLVVRHVGTTEASQGSLLACGPQSVSANLRLAPLTDVAGNSPSGALAVYAEIGGKRFLLLANPETIPVRVGNEYRGSDRLAIIPLKSA